MVCINSGRAEVLRPAWRPICACASPRAQILARLNIRTSRACDAGISAKSPIALSNTSKRTDHRLVPCARIDVEARSAVLQCARRPARPRQPDRARDLKPSNSLVDTLDEVPLDFGIAKLLDTPEHAPENTGTGLRSFTLHYAAPEQVRGEPVTTMTDVYSLGVVLYELLADCKPYRLKRQTDAEWEEAILIADPLRPSVSLQRAADADATLAPVLRRRAREVTGDLDNIVLKTLANARSSASPRRSVASLHRISKKPVRRGRRAGVPGAKYVHRHRGGWHRVL